MPESNPSAIDLFWTNLKVIIGAQWPEVVGTVFKDVSIERRDWINDAQSGRLQMPYAIVKMSHANTTDWSCYPTIKIDCTVSYIDGLRQAKDRASVNGQNITANSWLLQECKKLAKSIETGLTLGTIMPDMTFTANAENAVNEVMLKNSLEYEAASFTFSSIMIDF